MISKLVNMLKPPKGRRVQTPTLLQMEAVECGAAALGIILGYYGHYVPLEELRIECGISRDGSKATNILKAARKYGLEAQGYKYELSELVDQTFPVILFWNFNHFLVLEGIRGNKVYLNDPAMGPRIVTLDELDQAYTGVTLAFSPGPLFVQGGERRNIMRSLKTRLSGSHHALTFIVLSGLFLVIPGLVVPTFSRVFVDEILVRHTTSWFKPLLIGMALTLVLRGVLTWLQQYFMLRFETRMALMASRDFFRHVFRLPISFFAQRFAGDIASRVALNDKIANLFSGPLADSIVNLPLIPFYAIIMFHYDVVLTSLSIVIAMLNLAALRYVSRKRTDINQQVQQESGKLAGVAMNGLQMIETLKATGTESDFFSQFSGYQTSVMNANQRLGFSSQMLSVVPSMLSTLNTVLILGVGGIRVMDGDLTMGMLIAFQSLMGSFMQPVNQMISMGSVMQETVADINRLDDVLRYPQDPNAADTDAPEALPADTAPKLSGRLELRDVAFGYSRLEEPLIEGFDLTLKPGSRVALVGASGSGKTTVAKLVAGLYEPWSGEILFDDKPMRQIPRIVFNNSVACVDQDICLFEGSVRNNITMWDSTLAEARIIGAAKDASIHDDIALRGGYSAKLDEGGQNFSGGQRQRMEIARALAVDPSILVLDEATSALDAYTEKQVDDCIRRRGCTCLIIAHRLSTIRDCDEIIVMERGKVVQRGTHEELKNAEGLYADLIKIA